MSKISREPGKAVKEKYDLIIVGGGIYGITLSYMASIKGLKSLLLERDDFGGATSYNSLRILHGGLRYLQKLDLHRFFESVQERKWFFKNFPHLVEPLACIMPLYNRGLHRTSIFRVALLLNDLLSLNRNKGIKTRNHLNNGRVISKNKVKEIFPAVDTKGLKGGALWFDGSMPDSQKILIEILKSSCSNGGTALNYFEVQNLNIENNIVTGVSATDKETNTLYEFKSGKVVNTAGPWSREVAEKWHQDNPQLFHISIAWNILFNRKSLSDHAIAITPHKPDAKTYFLRPWKGMLFAGTIHEAWTGIEQNPKPKRESILSFIHEINSCVPDLNLQEQNILHIYSGLLPAKTEGSSELAVREIILNHLENNGPNGFYTVSGVKFTTARLVAEKVINIVFPNKKEVRGKELISIEDPSTGLYDFNWKFESESKIEELRKIIEDESVVHLDDLIIRRTSIGDNPLSAIEVAEKIIHIFEWDSARIKLEIERVKNYYYNYKNSLEPNLTES